MGGEKKVLQKAKNIFKNLKTDPNSVQFSEEKIDNRLVKNQKKKKKIKTCKRFFTSKTYRDR